VAGDTEEALMALFEQAAGLHLQLRVSMQELHRRPELTTACRGVLRELMEAGSRTVPQLARLRSCSRQHVQVLVNRLCRDGLAELVDNPDHRRSRLVRLTAEGRAALEAMWAREAEAVGALPVTVSADELVRAAEVLRSVRRTLGDDA
jgi:DNA-binding MarR family transcriptional regulator